MGEDRNGKNGDQVISAGSGRRLQARQAMGRAFTRARQRQFLDSFAASCNVRRSAEEAGVSYTTVYRLRRRDGAFREAWEAAQEQGYAALEAELVRRARELLEGVGETDNGKEASNGMDAKLAHTILQRHRQTMGQAPGDVIPKKSDLAEATARLEKVMRRMKLQAEHAAEEPAGNPAK